MSIRSLDVNEKYICPNCGKQVKEYIYDVSKLYYSLVDAAIVGSSLEQRDYGDGIFTRRAKWYVWLVLLFVDIGLINIYGTANLASRSFGFIPLYLAVSFLGSWLCIAACNYIESKNVNRLRHIVERIGKYSIVVLCTHQILLTFLQLTDYRFLNYGIQRTGEFEGIIMAVLIMVITYLIMPIMLRCLGWSFGLHNLKKGEA